MKFQESLSRTKVLERRKSEAKLRRGRNNEENKFARRSIRCKVCGDSHGSDNVKKEVNTCVSDYRTPNVGKYGWQEEPRELELQEKQWTTHSSRRMRAE
eukprot:6216239-Karenia_brevis.AAC.1